MSFGAIFLINGGTVYTTAEILALISGTAASVHTHVIGDVTGLTAAINDSVPTGAEMVTALNAALGSTVWQGGGAAAAWGAITGTIGAQTDLTTAINDSVPTGAEMVTALDTQLGSTVWQTHPTGAAMVTAINAAIGSTVWQGGGSGTPAWGTIVGTLADQTDLQGALNAKAPTSHTHLLAEITDIIVTSDKVTFTQAIRPGLYDHTGVTPLGAMFRSTDGHLYYAHDDGSVHLLCDSGGYGGAATDWGDITGTLSFQADLLAALDAKQTQHANLTAIASFAREPNTAYYTDPFNQLNLMTVTPFARDLLDDASAVGMRNTLGIAIGSNVQGHSGMLQSIANKPQPFDAFLWYDGSGVIHDTPITAAARALLDDSSASGMRITLGLIIGTNVQAYSSRLATFVTVLDTPLPHASQAAVAGTAGGSYTATEQGVINDLVTLVNRLRTELIAARIIKGSA